MSPPVVRLRGCPLAAQPTDVSQFLGNYGIPPDRIVMGLGVDGMPNGDAYAAVPDEGYADSIIQECHGAYVQGVMIEITKSDYSIWCRATEGKAIVDGPGNVQMNGGYGAATSTPSTVVGQFLQDAGVPILRLRGCPLAAQPTDVSDFLNNYSVQPKEVVMGVGQDGMPNGDAYVMLQSEATADRIIQEKNGADVQGILIEITKSSFNVWCQATEGKPIQDSPAQTQMNSGYGPSTVASTGDVRASPYGLQQNPSPVQAQTSTTGDEQKDWLIQQVKQIQQAGETEKQKWWTYCDSKCAGARDPKLFSKEFLQIS